MNARSGSPRVDEKGTASNSSRGYHACEPNIQETIASQSFRILYVLECRKEKMVECFPTQCYSTHFMSKLSR